MTTQQKPLLKFWGRLWYCGHKYGSGLCGVIGVGYTPVQAYTDWRQGAEATLAEVSRLTAEIGQEL